MENFVSFNQAIILWKLGYDYNTDYWYYDETKQIVRVCGSDCFDFNNMTPAPTRAQVHTWLRETHGIDINIDSVYHQLDTGNKIMYGLRIGDQSTFKIDFYINYDSYDEAISTGINKALEIISKRK